MAYSTIPKDKINKIRKAFIKGAFSGKLLAQDLKIHPNTVYDYIRKFAKIQQQHPDRLGDFNFQLPRKYRGIKTSGKYISLINSFPEIISGIKASKLNLKTVHSDYLLLHPGGFKFSQFSHYFYQWRVENNERHLPNKYLMNISVQDEAVLKSWKNSPRHRNWQKAVTILEYAKGRTKISIANQVDAGRRAVRNWIHIYQTKGIVGFDAKPYAYNAEMTKRMADKETNLMKLMHEGPALHHINCTTWKITDLSETYLKVYGLAMSRATVSFYLKKQGFAFKKARAVLTSTDPEFRKKLDHITHILSNLGANERFFSVDEYGPFAVKTKGGKSLIQHGQLKTYQQVQKSKGSLICTAALELSTNQVTHYYSPGKNTDETIKLIQMLLIKYKRCTKLYLSWDAAAWHASKKLTAFVDEINSNEHRSLDPTPLIAFAPLPSSSQFLNVIESVFSGLARSVIHNSDYGSVDECKAAINRHFTERNEHFKLNPKRAGNRIWGKEIVKPVFNVANNCKDPRNR